MKNPENMPRFRFTQDEPKPIVRDFNTFINYIEDSSFALGEKTGNIPLIFDLTMLDWELG